MTGLLFYSEIGYRGSPPPILLPVYEQPWFVKDAGAFPLLYRNTGPLSETVLQGLMLTGERTMKYFRIPVAHQFILGKSEAPHRW